MVDYDFSQFEINGIHRNFAELFGEPLPPELDTTKKKKKTEDEKGPGGGGGSSKKGGGGAETATGDNDSSDCSDSDSGSSSDSSSGSGEKTSDSTKGGVSIKKGSGSSKKGGGDGKSGKGAGGGSDKSRTKRMKCSDDESGGENLDADSVRSVDSHEFVDDAQSDDEDGTGYVPAGANDEADASSVSKVLDCREVLSFLSPRASRSWTQVGKYNN